MDSCPGYFSRDRDLHTKLSTSTSTSSTLAIAMASQSTSAPRSPLGPARLLLPSYQRLCASVVKVGTCLKTNNCANRGAVSQDSVTGSDQKNQTFWKRVHEDFVAKHLSSEERIQQGLQSRWSHIQNHFCACFAKVEARRKWQDV